MIDRSGCRRIAVDGWDLFPAREYLALKDALPKADLVPTDLLTQGWTGEAHTAKGLPVRLVVAVAGLIVSPPDERPVAQTVPRSLRLL